MADPVPSACPFDGYASPILQQYGHNNQGLATYRVQCPICRNATVEHLTKQSAVDDWGARATPATPTYVTWLAAFAARQVASPPTADVAPSYTAWLASAETEAGVAADVAAFETWIVAHPPAADVAPSYVTWEAALAAWLAAHPPVAD
jgi:hypothetical protein